MSFHEIRFPTGISRGAQGGPERRTDVVVLGSGFEERNTRWLASRRSYDAGYGVRSLDALHEVIAFFEERRGRFHGFRWRDHTDWKSGAPGAQTTAFDQVIGEGDSSARAFQLRKTYGALHAPFVRDIAKPVAGSVKVAVNGAVRIEGTHFSVDAATGMVLFGEEETPAADTVVTAGFEFDVPVRFDTDKLEINLSGFQSGAIPRIPIVEIRL
ncbi:glycoside hydrolase family 24 [Hyphomicrobium nitrativorans NL23]|uniref:Glycoside hydrolase family 24 n=1 Tax=Hyphomicrobium nitrativorans NL23 TaxID=1029756 RepID=V5SEW4_9HYPH|nr:DUF2460 domain-containing protein [Hyphomicrobium nitrativorans]AHB49037.1 glycoside hydrolase family 24 [Hyphomicrobium nitrativorans NL23]